MITPILESDRILLRPLSVKDAEHIYKNWTTDPDVAKFMIWDLHTSIEDTIEWLKLEEENIKSDEHYVWGFVQKDTGELFGSGGINYKKEIDCFEIGYNIMKKYWGQGLTTEACQRIIDFATNTLGLEKLFGRHAVENIGSEKVLRKLGFQYVADEFYESTSKKKRFASKDYYLYLK